MQAAGTPRLWDPGQGQAAGGIFGWCWCAPSCHPPPMRGAGGGALCAGQGSAGAPTRAGTRWHGGGLSVGPRSSELGAGDEPNLPRVTPPHPRWGVPPGNLHPHVPAGDIQRPRAPSSRQGRDKSPWRGAQGNHPKPHGRARVTTSNNPPVGPCWEKHPHDSRLPPGPGRAASVLGIKFFSKAVGQTSVLFFFF